MVMAADDRIRATLRSGLTHVRLLLMHPMHTGRHFNAEKILIEAEFIQDIRCWRNDIEVLAIKCGVATSQNPYFSFQLTGGTIGDVILVRWVDNIGAKGLVKTRVT
tara:strand:- start:449 stop:766 length:318 start_codon:yes stop_codon:yes gene_type:complete